MMMVVFCEFLSSARAGQFPSESSVQFTWAVIIITETGILQRHGGQYWSGADITTTTIAAASAAIIDHH
jgi:hypothetical protein